jgi:hypothetical protein
MDVSGSESCVLAGYDIADVKEWKGGVRTSSRHFLCCVVCHICLVAATLIARICSLIALPIQSIEEGSL